MFQLADDTYTNEQGVPATDLIFVPDVGNPLRLEPTQSALMNTPHEKGMVVLLFKDKAVFKFMYEMLSDPKSIAQLYYEELLLCGVVPSKERLLAVMNYDVQQVAEQFYILLAEFLAEMEPETNGQRSLLSNWEHLKNGLTGGAQSQRAAFQEQLADHIIAVVQELEGEVA